MISDPGTTSSHQGDGRSSITERPSEEMHLESQVVDEKKDDSDPNLVTWNGPDDPENPYNWPRGKKVGYLALLSITSLYSQLASTMFAPGAKQLVDEFHVTSSIEATFTVSIYVLGFAIGPVFIAPMSELYGRYIIYQTCNLLYFGFTLGCAFSANIAQFLVFRILCGLAASGPLTIGGGTIADFTPQEERGRAIALFGVGPLLGPVLGPVIGGFVSERVGWRWSFRIIAILAGVVGVITFIFMRETKASVLLSRKAQRLRKETGNERLHTGLKVPGTPAEILLRSITRPVKILIYSPIVVILSLYTGLMFGLSYLLFTTFPQVFEGTYGFSTGTSGLSYLGLGTGFFASLFLFARLSDKLLKQKRGATVARPEERLILMKWFAPICPAGIFIYAWTVNEHIHWIVPIIGTFLIGFSTLFVVLPVQGYFVDAFGPEAAASALAANYLIRSPFGAFLTFAAPPLYSKLGLGWGNSVLGFICLAFTPVPWLFYYYGERIRIRFPIKL
ncbi:major facilitator superfamily domain-containing protein [Xylariaceae sp. FL1019]|nr:major facilitator superfamily domain-containing protein [Xylariaceae sp. FL1019]